MRNPIQNFLDNIYDYFCGVPKPAQKSPVELDGFKEVIVKKPEVKKTEMELIIDKFNANRDMIVISEKKYTSLNEGERIWLESLDDRVFLFKEDSLVNVAIVRAL
jgi:hypothetical protein